MKYASIELTAPEMTAVSYPNSSPPSVATNVNPTTSEVFTFVIESPSFIGENFVPKFSRN